MAEALATRGLIDRNRVLAERSSYDWSLVVDHDWYPEPRYGDV